MLISSQSVLREMLCRHRAGIADHTGTTRFKGDGRVHPKIVENFLNRLARQVNLQ